MGGAVLQGYEDVAPHYWVSVLREALSRYPDLVSRGPEFGKYAHGKLTGEEIVQRYREGGLEFDDVGRGDGGIAGPRFKQDIGSGKWRTVRYEVRKGSVPQNPNWFSIGEFLTAT